MLNSLQKVFLISKQKVLVFTLIRSLCNTVHPSLLPPSRFVCRAHAGSKRLMSEAPLDPEMAVETVRVGRRAQRVWLQVRPSPDGLSGPPAARRCVRENGRRLASAAGAWLNAPILHMVLVPTNNNRRSLTVHHVNWTRMELSTAQLVDYLSINTAPEHDNSCSSLTVFLHGRIR